MKQKTVILALFAASILSSSCGQKQPANEGEKDTVEVAASEDTLLLLTVPKTALYGHLGEDTGMSTLELITTNGDTVTLDRTDEQTGKDGLILGDIRNYTDTFAVVPNADGTSFLKAINITEINELKDKYIVDN